jgi:3-hydroxybutyryl-CoA dehydrogenase
MNIQKVAVIGGGTMGLGIAQTYAAYGFETVLIDNQPESLEFAKRMIAANAASLLKAEFLTASQAAAATENVSYASDISAAADADLVVEAVPENVKIKSAVFQSLDELCRCDAIFASTTSAMNIYEAVTVSHPERLLITHWCNPPHIIPLVELVIGPETCPEVVATIREQLERMEKSPVILKQYVPGFIVNRLNLALMRECSYMVEQGWVSAEDVDIAFSANQGIKAPFEGPLEMVDHIGWDIGFAAGIMLYPHISSSLEPSKMANQLLSEGRLGVKSGRGLYDYSGKSREQVQNERNERVAEIAKVARELRKYKKTI